jgi:uncharacterized protein
MSQALEYFCVFGGLGVNLDTKLSFEKLVQIHILDEYSRLRNEVSLFCGEDNTCRAVLSGIALGDRRTNSAFKRAKVSFHEGMNCVEEFKEKGILSSESSQQAFKEPFEPKIIAEKLFFATPFLHFWFAFVSPIFQGIKEGNYEEFFQRFHNRKIEFYEVIFQKLCFELFKNILKDEKIDKFGSYWDDELQVDLLCKTRSKKIIAGVCKYSDTKMKKSELTKLNASCDKLGIIPDAYIFFAKKGFSSELKSLKNENFKLFTCKSLKMLCEN